MIEALNVIMKVVWIIVGISIIGTTVWSVIFTRKLYNFDKGDEEET